MMTPEQFDVLAKLMRSTGGASREAARLVLVEGLTRGEAARQAGASMPNTIDAEKRFRAADELVRTAYVGVRRKAAARRPS